jgi:hypothetical protein
VDEPKKEATSEFNASEYLFVSSRIARSFPNLKTSGLVQEFNTPLPKKPYGVAERDATRAYRMKLRITALVNNMGVLLMVFLGYLSSLPAPLHDMLIDCLGWCFFGYISLLHVILYKKNPLYVLIMAVCMVTLFAALLYYQSIRIAKFRHEQDATTPLEQPFVEEEENTSEHNEETSPRPRWRSASQCTKSARLLLLRLTQEH